MRKLAITLTALVALGHLSCSDASGPGNQGNDRISITNNAGVLAARVTYRNDSIPLDTIGVGYSAPAPLGSAPINRSSVASQASINMSLKAEVTPPSIGGQMLQATSVAIVGNLAVVSYNMGAILTWVPSTSSTSPTRTNRCSRPRRYFRIPTSTR
ncbi:MAG: hypothetical protein ABR537_02695 [Gemmatimonadales bacterium]